MACGWNANGQLGDGTDTNRYTPFQVSSLSGITSVSGGGSHSLFLKNDGTVWSCGWNGDGRLGDGTWTDSNLPVYINSLSGIIAVSAGGYHSLFLKNDGTVWACGDNNNGELGNGTFDTIPPYGINTPAQVNFLTGIISVSAGWNHSLFLKNDGTVWACGDNYYGQLGNGTTTDSNTPVQLNSLSGIIAVSAGVVHSLFLKNDGTVWACGYNAQGELGDGTNTLRNTPVQVQSLCSAFTGEDEIIFENYFLNCFPNPSTGNFILESNTPIKSISIYTIEGKKVKEFFIPRLKEIEINLKELGQGIYFMRVSDGEKNVVRKLIVE